jgi:phage host-nuclease inhibitor protein Gam
MDKINDFESKKEIEIEDKKETPLSVRVDSYYKDMFLELSEQPGYNRKRLLESMISSYIRKAKDENRHNNLNLEHEISLISGSLDDILRVFKTVSVKAQDTIGSNRSFYEQQIENLKKNIEALELKIQGIEEERKRLLLQNKDMELNIRDTGEENRKLSGKITNLQEELTKSKDAYAAVLNEVYNLRRIDGENVRLVSENKELLGQIEKSKDIINKKEKNAERQNYDYEMLELKKNQEIEFLKGEIEAFKNQIANMRKNKDDELKEAEKLIRKEVELKKEAEILQLRQEYNNLQMQYIKDIGVVKSNKEV